MVIQNNGRFSETVMLKKDNTGCDSTQFEPDSVRLLDPPFSSEPNLLRLKFNGLE
jgi:hypothetical protein